MFVLALQYTENQQLNLKTNLHWVYSPFLQKLYIINLSSKEIIVSGLAAQLSEYDIMIQAASSSSLKIS